MRDGLRKLRHAGTHLELPLFLLFLCPACPFLGVCSLLRVPLSFFFPRRSPLARVLARSLARLLPPAEQAANRRKNIFFSYPSAFSGLVGHFGLAGETRTADGGSANRGKSIGRLIFFPCSCSPKCARACARNSSRMEHLRTLISNTQKK